MSEANLPHADLRRCLRCGAETTHARCPQDCAPTICRQVAHREELPAGTVIDDRYAILGLIAKGASGAVYRARHTTTEHPIAIKVLRPMSGGDHLLEARRFFREAARTAGLGHPNTVRVFDFGQTDHGELFLAMELLRGTSVARRLARYGRQGRLMSSQLAVMIGVGVLRSLGEAHAAGIVHRDLKPENVILHEAGPHDLAIKVVDFGVARDEQTPREERRRRVGTVTHMSPEQVRGLQADPRSDLYSVGVILYECLTGTVPFAHADPLRTAAAHVTDEPTPPGQLRMALAGTPLEAVVMKSLRKDPEQRWQTAFEMRHALLEAIGKEDLFMIDANFESSVMQPISLLPEAEVSADFDALVESDQLVPVVAEPPDGLIPEGLPNRPPGSADQTDAEAADGPGDAAGGRRWAAGTLQGVGLVRLPRFEPREPEPEKR